MEIEVKLLYSKTDIIRRIGITKKELENIYWFAKHCKTLKEMHYRFFKAYSYSYLYNRRKRYIELDILGANPDLPTMNVAVIRISQRVTARWNGKY